jgi:signal transduction histidine kinase
MTDWVDSMLDIDRLRRGELPLELAEFDLARLVWSVAAEFQQATGRHIRVIAGILPRATVTADRNRLRQVLTNLLDNAVNYAPNGTIELRLGTRTDRVFVAVHDHGPGLNRAHLDAIFEPYQQVGGQQARRRSSMGLGLYLARQIARIHGGDLWAESRGRGRGSTFVLALPLARK